MKSQNSQFYCSVCFSQAVQSTAWIDPNTGKVVDAEGPLEGGYCSACGSELPLELTKFGPGDLVLIAQDGGPAYGWYQIQRYDSTLSMESKEVCWAAKRLLDELPQVLTEDEAIPSWETDCQPTKRCAKCNAYITEPQLAYSEPERCISCADPS